MSSFLSRVPVASRLMGTRAAEPFALNLPPVETHPVESIADRRARCLKHLLKANHANYAILFNKLLFHNHNPHALCSAYLLGASEAKLHEIYETEIERLDPWKPSPAEVADLDWGDFVGDKRYERAFVDYFEDKLAMRFTYDWKREVQHFLFECEKPLVHGLMSGLGHPLIHLSYAYEMDSKEVAMEALGLACVEYDFLAKYTEDAAYAELPAPQKVASPMELLIRMSGDDRFAAFPREPGPGMLEAVFKKREALILEYWNAWDLSDPQKQFELSQEAAVALLVATVKPAERNYNFFLVHLLTTSHALRVLLPFLPPESHMTLIRQWWLLAVAVFISTGRPLPDPGNVIQDVGGRGWPYVEEEARTSAWSNDAHYIKAIRAIRDVARTWGDPDEAKLRAAVTFVDNFQGWAR